MTAPVHWRCSLSDGDQERWMGLVIESELGGVPAMEDVRFPAPCR